MCLNIGAPKPVNFPFGTNGKLMVLEVQNFCTTGRKMFVFAERQEERLKNNNRDLSMVSLYHLELISP